MHPPSHNGVVMFSAKTRIQADPADIGGTVYLYIRINGQRVGSLAVQELGNTPNTVSTRTLSSSYLSAAPGSLAAGCHTVEAVGVAQGDFRHLMMDADLPLVWFD